MKKFLSFMVSTVIVVGFVLGVVWIVMSLKKNEPKEYVLNISSSNGGSVYIAIGNDNDIVSSDDTKSFKVKDGKNVTLTASPETLYDFTQWTINNTPSNTTDLDITLTMDKNTNVNAIFNAKLANITVTDSEGLNDTFDVKLTDNLLDKLNTKYPSDIGYEYVYKIDGNIVDSSTTITNGLVLTREKRIINYTVTFKHNDEIIAIKTYNIENLTINEPNPPTEEGQIITWEDFSLDNLGDIVVNTIVSPIEYTTRFKLPTGYTFEDGTNYKDISYLKNATVIAPSLDGVVSTDNNAKHYTLSWPAFEPNYTSTVVVINAIKAPIQYSVTFKNGSDTIATEYYSIENKTVTEPTLNIPGHTVLWSNYSLDSMTNLVVNAIVTPIQYVARFTLPSGYTFSDGNSYKDVVYYYDNASITAPSLEGLSNKQYKLSWPSYTLDFNNTLNVITAAKTPIQYSVTFKNGTETVATEYYSVENMTVTEPIVNIDHYENFAWEYYDLTTFTDIVVNLHKTPIQYSIRFQLPDGYTFDDNSTFKMVYYTVENYNTVTNPTLPITTNGYTLAWENYTLNGDNSGVITVVNAIATKTTFTVKFVHLGSELSSFTYNLDNISSIDVASRTPAVPTSDDSSYIYKWEPFSLSTSNMKDITVNTLKLIKVDIEYYVGEDRVDVNPGESGSIYEDINILYNFVFVAMNSNNTAITDDNDKVIIYEVDGSNTKYAKEIKNLDTILNNSIVDDETGNVAKITAITRYYNYDLISKYNIPSDYSILEALDKLLRVVHETGHRIVLTYAEA